MSFEFRAKLTCFPEESGLDSVGEWKLRGTQSGMYFQTVTFYKIALSFGNIGEGGLLHSSEAGKRYE